MFLQKYQVIVRRGQGDMWQYTAHAQFSLLLSNAALLLSLLESLHLYFPTGSLYKQGRPDLS